MWGKKHDTEKINMMGMIVLFSVQNSFFVHSNDDKDTNKILKDNVKKYVGNPVYNNFIQQHKLMRDSILDGNESLHYYVSNLVPKEPLHYPMSVEEAQNKRPELLLDIITLELQYFLILAVSMTINGVAKDLGYNLFPYFVSSLEYAGWSEEGRNTAYELGVERMDEYATLLQMQTPSVFSMLASKTILNTEARMPILMDHFTGIFEHYENCFKGL
jgi:hypothetical protein